MGEVGEDFSPAYCPSLRRVTVPPCRCGRVSTMRRRQQCPEMGNVRATGHRRAPSDWRTSACGTDRTCRECCTACHWTCLPDRRSASWAGRAQVSPRATEGILVEWVVETLTNASLMCTEGRGGLHQFVFIMFRLPFRNTATCFSIGHLQASPP